MKLAFVLFHYFPYGGLERDMLEIARLCVARGHNVIVYTQRWKGEYPDRILVRELPVVALTNHGKAIQFVRKFQEAMAHAPADLIIGFNKMPGLDIYFAADTCFAQKAFEERGWLYRLGARCRAYLALESSVFNSSSATRILILSPQQIPAFKRYYHVADERLHVLPPGIRRDRIAPENHREQRSKLRHQYNVSDDTYLLLMVGSDFQRKGVQRTLRALAQLSNQWQGDIQLWVAGQDDPSAIVRLAKELGISDRVKVLGARDDVPQLMWAADLFVHPAHSEAAGIVLLEAVVAGLPVVATDVCGYAHYITKAGMGEVITSKQADSELADVIARLARVDKCVWQAQAKSFVASENIFSMHEHVARFIESR